MELTIEIAAQSGLCLARCSNESFTYTQINVFAFFVTVACVRQRTQPLEDENCVSGADGAERAAHRVGRVLPDAI
jgi:hypothetical protein